MLLYIRRVSLTLFLFFFALNAFCQSPKRHNSSDIYLALNKLNVLGSVLYIAAHPDDENTRLISWLANEKLVSTGYLSLTRGDGGQNLIGPEISASLGVIRTQELLKARKIDGGQQFFSRAKDFGFSKNPEETFSIWDREKVLSDMVWVIRKFRPDIIITRFSSVPGKTHGHHTASAILAEEAFKAAGDKTMFPEQLQHVSVWQPKRLLWNTSWWFYGDEKNFDKSGLLPIDVGGYNPLLGKSYTEIAAESRSMHKSQGFGASLERGRSIEYLEPILGSNSTDDLFYNINTGWSRVENGKAIGSRIQNVITSFDPQEPAASVPDLVEIYKMMESLPESHWKTVKVNEIKTIIQACMGLFLEVTSSKSSSAPGEETKVTLEAVNRSAVPAELLTLGNNATHVDSTIHINLENNHPLLLTQHLKLPENMPYSQPYWLKEEGSLGMFSVADPALIGKAEDSAAVIFYADIKILNEPFSFSLPLVYKYTDPVKGEQYQPFEVTPPVFMNLDDKVYIFPDGSPKRINVRVTSSTAHIDGTLKLEVPPGWQVSPKSVKVNIVGKGNISNFSFMITPPLDPTEASLQAVLNADGKTYLKSMVSIEYDHIPKQTLYPNASAKIVKLDIKKEGELIGYIMGAGDNIPASLEQIGYKVDLLNEDLISSERLQKYDAIILGVRAYNTVDRLKFYQPTLLNYVKEGGTLIVQYNTNSRLITEDIGPYPLSISRDRVTVEDAKVRILQPNHPLLNYPNKITPKDFENWVQERGLYFPDQWSEEYAALLSSNDPGESPKDGGLLVAPYGKGHYIYTGYSWFRELPAGVPGAYRLFANMISIGKNTL